MKLKNVTVAILWNVAGQLKVKRIVQNPELPSDGNGTPVYGPMLRRVLSVAEIVKRDGLSRNKAQTKRESQCLSCLADFPGQSPLFPVQQAA